MKFENPSSRIIEATRRAIISDMHPRNRVVHTKVLSALLMGGSFAFLFCLQFESSLVPPHAYASLNQKTGEIACSILSALAYMTFALISLRFICSPFQFRFIINKRSSIVAQWTVLLGTIALSSHSEHLDDFGDIAAWISGAIAVLLCVRFFQSRTLYTKRERTASPF